MTEALSNAVLTNWQNCSKFSIEIIQKLIGALTSFFEEAKAPSLLNSIVFNLLSRLVRKLRYIYRQIPSKVESQTKEELKQHLKKLFIKQEFIESMLSELLLHKEQEEQSVRNQGSAILYPAFV